jgi:hypothetical protein
MLFIASTIVSYSCKAHNKNILDFFSLAIHLDIFYNLTTIKLLFIIGKQ